MVYTCLTNISFTSQRKCEQYWPDNVNDTYDAGNLSVTLTDLVPYADYEIKRFSIKDVSALSFYHYMGSSPFQCYVTLAFVYSYYFNI